MDNTDVVINKDFSKFAGTPLSETRTYRSTGDYKLEVSDNALVIPVGRVACLGGVDGDCEQMRNAEQPHRDRPCVSCCFTHGASCAKLCV